METSFSPAMVESFVRISRFFATLIFLGLLPLTVRIAPLRAHADIDFGFMLGISPGGVGFEACPFKLTQEYIDVLGGIGSPKYEEFKKLMRQGFKDVRKEAERIIMIVELMAKDSKLPCFALGDLTASNLRDRFALALSAQQVDDFVDRLILASCASSYTRLYDTFQ